MYQIRIKQTFGRKEFLEFDLIEQGEKESKRMTERVTKRKIKYDSECEYGFKIEEKNSFWPTRIFKRKIRK